MLRIPPAAKQFLTGVLESFPAVSAQVGAPNRRPEGVEGPIPAEVDTRCVCVHGCLLAVTQLVIWCPLAVPQL